MATKRQCLSFNENEAKVMTKGKSVSRIREKEAKANTDACICCANLYTLTPCLHRAQGVWLYTALVEVARSIKWP